MGSAERAREGSADLVLLRAEAARARRRLDCGRVRSDPRLVRVRVRVRVRIHYPDFIAANQVYALWLCSPACYLTGLLSNCCLRTCRLLLTYMPTYQLTDVPTYQVTNLLTRPTGRTTCCPARIRRSTSTRPAHPNPNPNPTSNPNPNPSPNPYPNPNLDQARAHIQPYP